MSLPVDLLQLPEEIHDADILVAVSGGSDSVALLLLLLELSQRGDLGKARLHVAHFDHQWSNESRATSQFVEELAAGLQLPFFTETSAETAFRLGCKLSGSPPALPGLGPEGTARKLRYEFLTDVTKPFSRCYLLTGHTWDDQAETVWLRISRGTGVEGLAGIPDSRPLTEQTTLLRPLLHVRRSRLLDYLAQRGQRFIVDPSNEDTALARNQTRHLVFPWLEQHGAKDIQSNLVRLSEAAGDWRAIWEHFSPLLQSAVLKLEPDFFQVQRQPLNQVPEPVVRQLLIDCWRQSGLPLQEMNRGSWMKLSQLICRPSHPQQWPAEHHFPGPVRARRSAGILTVGKFAPNIKKP